MSAARILQAIRAIVFAGLAAATAAHAATAPAAAPSATETCLMCHADKDAKNAAGKSIAVDAAKFAGSVHGELKLECTNCHADASADKIPHADKLKPVDCASCHGKEAKEYAGTVHGTARKGGSTIAANCTDCHGTHDILRSKDAASRTNHANVEATCSTCHGSEAMAATGKLPGGNVGGKFHDSIHGKALKGAAQGSAPTCNNCHGSHNIRPKSDEGSRTHRARVPETCGSCHKPERDAYMGGMHGKLRQDGVLAAPGCTDCHSAHGIEQHDAPRFQTEVIKECGNCHGDYLSTYRDTFHGQVTDARATRGWRPARRATARTTCCRRRIPSRWCRRRTGSRPARPATPGAAANFASFDPHASKHDKARDPIYYYSAKFMELLLLGVFAFFGIHTVLWLYRELAEKLARGKGGGNGKERH